MSTDSTPNIDYSSRDYAGFRDSLLAYATTRMPEWRGARTGDPNDFGVVLAELLAYEGDVLSFYTDVLAHESFLSTARRRDSVFAHAALLDYTPRPATAATAALTFTVTTTTSAVIVPRGFQVAAAATSGAAGSDTLVFETTQPLVFPASSLRGAQDEVLPERRSLDVIAAEGRTVVDEVLGTLCGDPLERFPLAQAPALLDSVVLRVVERPDSPGQVWQRVANLLDAGPDDNAYTLTHEASGAVVVGFGDGVNGRIAPRGSVAHVTYRVGGGSLGNVDSGVITDPLDALQFAGTTAPTELVVVNTQPARGGADAESLASIRANAPRARQTGRRAVSLEDYEVLARTVPGEAIAKAKAVAKVYTHITLYVAPPGGALPDSEALQAVSAYLLPRKMAGVTVVVASPSYVPVDVALHIHVDPRHAQAAVRDAVQRAVQAALDFDAVGFGGSVSLSSLYAAAIAVQGVRNVVVRRVARTGEAVAGDVDLVLADNEIPRLGLLDLTAEGGVVNSGDAAHLGSRPVPTAAPALQLLRCDPTSTHVELTWVPGDATTHWEVEIEHRASDGTVAASTVAGPFSYPEAIFDLPRIGAGRATVLALRTRAFNGSTGPESSPFLTTPYTCE